jgi:hypothetical protein
VDNLDHGIMEGTLQGLCSIIPHAGIFDGQHQHLDQQHDPSEPQARARMSNESMTEKLQTFNGIARDSDSQSVAGLKRRAGTISISLSLQVRRQRLG